VRALRGRSPTFWMGVVVALVSLVVPVALNDSQLTVYVFIGLSVIVVAGLSLLMGFAGQISLGQAAFYAIGAYTAALLTRALGVPPLVSLAAATAFTAGVAVVVGLPLLRLRGHYLAFATLAFQLIVLSVIGEARGLTGGDTGMPGIPTLSIGPLAIQGQYRAFVYAYVTWVLVVGVLLFNRNLVRSRPGRGLRALATSEAGALAAGVPVARYKLQVFALSAAYAGLAGGVYAFFVSYIAPGSFPVLLSIQFLIMATVGGLGSVWGSAVGAVVVYLLVQVLQSVGTGPGLPPQLPAILSYAVYGLVLVLVMTFLPQGLVPALQARVAARRQVSALEAQARGQLD
jgi:branched-chain amino acid transport system permease protein